MNRDTDPTKLAEEYIDNWVRWEAVRNKPRIANRIVDRNHRIAMALKADERGRALLAGMQVATSRVVRLWAATEMLSVDSDGALKVLDALDADNQDFSFDASMAASEYRAGRLNPDW